MTLLDQATSSADASVTSWVEVCRFDDLVPDRGACALVDGEPVAVFRCHPDDALYAIGNNDPYSGSSVMSRGIVGSIGDRPVVASPLFKQRFDLRTGEAIDDPATTLAVHAVRCVDGVVQVSGTPVDAPPGPGRETTDAS
jgi:nitrite reductase (NADH) small subunit